METSPRVVMAHFPMYVCVCNGVTEREIRQAAHAGCGSVAELTMRTGCGACCGSCVEMAGQLLEAARADARPPVRDNIVAFPQISNAA